MLGWYKRLIRRRERIRALHENHIEFKALIEKAARTMNVNLFHEAIQMRAKAIHVSLLEGE